MSGGPTTSYTSSAQTNLPNPSRIWFVIDPGGVTTLPTYPPSNTATVTLKIYVQAAKPVSTDTPWHTEAVSGASFNAIGVIAGPATVMYWDKLEWTLEDYWAFRAADTGVKYAPVLHETGSNTDPGQTFYDPTGIAYLGTDKIYEVGETT